jgi:hypothetical protein
MFISCRVLGRVAAHDDAGAATISRAVLHLLDTAPDARQHLPQIVKAVTPALQHPSATVRRLVCGIVARFVAAPASEQATLEAASTMPIVLQVMRCPSHCIARNNNIVQERAKLQTSHTSAWRRLVCATRCDISSKRTSMDAKCCAARPS